MLHWVVGRSVAVSSSSDLEGRVVVITGASRGIGKAEALAFARHGARVVVVGRTVNDGDSRLPGGINDTVAEIEVAGGEAIAVAADVTKELDVARMVAETLEAFGGIDVLINNAAAAFDSPIMDYPLKRWNLVIDVNLTATFLCTKAVVPPMAAAGGGSIINTSSSVNETRSTPDNPAGTAYLVAKAGIEQFTYMSAAELAPRGIAVNCFKPAVGVITEGMLQVFGEEYLEHTSTVWGGPEKMIAAALFLAGQRPPGLSGTVAFDAELIAWHGLAVEPVP